jgi:protein TonB
VFLRAARQYLLARWRYRPASEDGRAVSSSTIITLRFTLEG